MYIDCLTALTLDDDCDKVFQDVFHINHDEYGKEKSHCDRIKSQIVLNELKNSHHYAYSEIRIGKISSSDPYIYFMLFRNNIEIAKIQMRKNVMEYFVVQPSSNDKVIDIIINQEAIKEISFDILFALAYPPFKGYNNIKKIRIRCIKVLKKGEANPISYEIQNLIKEYALKINEMVQNSSNIDLEDAQKNAFETFGPLKLPNETGKKAVNQKFSDLRDAINDLCNADNEKGKNVSTRYNCFIDHATEFKFCKKEKKEMKLIEKSSAKYYDERVDVNRDFSKYSTLAYENVSISSINLRWFNAPALISLTFNQCGVFQTPNAWEIFLNNISKLENLHILEISDCRLSEIPELLFSKLPNKIESLNFQSNNLTKISSQISRVKNLKYLNLENNSNLSNNTFPWNSLPENLEILYLKETKVSRIPPLDTLQLKNLRQIDFDYQDINDVNVFELAENLGNKSLKIYDKSSSECDEDDIKEQRFPRFICRSFLVKNSNARNYNEMDLSDRKLYSYAWETLSITLTVLNLSHNKLASIGSLRPLRNLTYLNLNANRIISIQWQNIPTNVEILNISSNLLTYIDSLEHLKKLKELYLSNNKITSIEWELLPIELIYICLRSNKLANIGSLKHLQHLTTLKAAENEINSVAWKDLPEGLQECDFCNNLIEKVDSTQHLKNLVTLKLARNNISKTAWEKLPEMIETLEISDNLLTCIDSIQHLKNLPDLNVQNNKISSIAWKFLPSCLESINFANNCIMNVKSMMHLKNLRTLKLQKNRITFVAWGALPKMVKKINLSHNLLTKVGSMKRSKKVSKLNLRRNKVSSVKWKSLPNSLRKLDLSDNLLKSVGSMKHLIELEYLYLQYNKFSYISEKILGAPELEVLYLNNNRISKIGDLSDDYISYLDLSNNSFNFRKGNLIENFWKNIPSTYTLILDGNNLIELPCQLKGNITKLNVKNCNLRYICPQIYLNEQIRINFANNAKLMFPFMPSILFSSPLPPSSSDPPHENDYSRITSNMKILPNVKKFTKTENKFKNVNLHKNFFCKCCARCEESGNDTKLIEKTMVMDCFFYDYEKMIDRSDDDEYERKKKALYTSLPGQWKTTVKTRLCDKCKKTIEEFEKVNENQNINNVDKEGDKMPRLNETNSLENNREQLCNLVVDIAVDTERAEDNYNILPPISSIYPSQNEAPNFVHNCIENIELLDLRGDHVLTVPASTIMHLQMPHEPQTLHSSSFQTFEEGVYSNTNNSHSRNYSPPQQCLNSHSLTNTEFSLMPPLIQNIDYANIDVPYFPENQTLQENSNNHTLYNPYSTNNDISQL